MKVQGKVVKDSQGTSFQHQQRSHICTQDENVWEVHSTAEGLCNNKNNLLFHVRIIITISDASLHYRLMIYI